MQKSAIVYKDSFVVRLEKPNTTLSGYVVPVSRQTGGVRRDIEDLVGGINRELSAEQLEIVEAFSKIFNISKTSNNFVESDIVNKALQITEELLQDCFGYTCENANKLVELIKEHGEKVFYKFPWLTNRYGESVYIESSNQVKGEGNMCRLCDIKNDENSGTVTFTFTDDDFNYLIKDIKKAKEQEDSCKNVPVLIVGLYELLSRIESKVFNKEYVTKLKDLAYAGKLFIDNDDVELPMDSFIVNESTLLLKSAQDVIDENYYELDLAKYEEAELYAEEAEEDEDEDEESTELTNVQKAYMKLLERIVKLETKFEKLECIR